MTLFYSITLLKILNDKDTIKLLFHPLEGAYLQKKHLLILTYEMDELSQVFSHQIGIVNELAKHFNKVTILSGKVGKYKVANNVNIYSSNWENGKKITSSIKFLRLFFKLIIKQRFSLVFSHMTNTQAALIAPITKILRINHYLWYTHYSNNLALRVCYSLTNGILTATAGSCPLSGKKVMVIGHSIDSVLFKKKVNNNWPLRKFVHIGRFDPSKNIDLIIHSLEKIRKSESGVTLTIVGSPSSTLHNPYRLNILDKFSHDKLYNWIVFNDSKARSSLPEFLEEFDCFIHAFDGSLDKAVLEATFMYLPVVTINKEYVKIFGSWDLSPGQKSSTLTDEVNSLLSLDQSQLSRELDRRYLIAKSGYEIEGWAKRAAQVFNS